MPEFNEFVRKVLPKDAPKRSHSDFVTVRVSETADELIEAHKSACVAFGMSEKMSEVSSSYSHLNVTQESLYKYIEYLEKRAGYTHQPIIKRF